MYILDPLALAADTFVPLSRRVVAQNPLAMVFAAENRICIDDRIIVPRFRLCLLRGVITGRVQSDAVKPDWVNQMQPTIVRQG